MARKCFFSFHYQKDIWRSQQVRNAWLTHKDREAAGFFDSSAFESKKRTGDDTLKAYLSSQLVGSSVTCALIGAETATRRWVRYELVKAFEQGKGLLGVKINSLKDKDGFVTSAGNNPLSYLGYEWDQQTGFVRFKEFKNASWQWFSDLPRMKYNDLPYVLNSTDATFSSLFSTYDYVSQNGYQSIGSWIENAATRVGR
jgi:hypothetical protein